MSVTPGNGGGGVLLRILGGGVSPGSPNPDPITDQNMSFSHSFSDLAPKIHASFQTWRRSENAKYMFSKI